MKITYALAAILSSGILVAETAQAAMIAPTAAFTARHISGMDVIVGGDPADHILYVKAGTEDRAVLAFDLRGEAVSPVSVYLNFYLLNIDSPRFTTLSLYAFEGNGLIEAADFHRTDRFVTSFSDFGATSSDPVHPQLPYSLDVTSQFNQFVTDGKRFLSFLLLADTIGARYNLNPYPGQSAYFNAISLNTQRLSDKPAVPESSSVTLLVLASLASLGRGWRRRRA